MKKNILKYKKLLMLVVGVLFITLVTCIYSFWMKGSKEFVFESETVSKGSISNTITATGTLEATNTVTVGTQVSGVIEKLYVDFNSVVKKGQLIAELDKYTLQSSLDNAQANLDNSLAEFEYQKSNLSRMKELYDKDLLAQSDYDLAMYTYKTSKAALKSSEADLDRAERNLSYATIYAPIDGIVLNRAVEEGQTVAASMSTPELFTITNMLSVMQVEADIDEADIGMIKDGLRVEFTVDAFPDAVFQGKVSEVRLQPVETSNVVTYTVIVLAENPDLLLKPGMTAGITVFVEEEEDVLVVSSKSIRFTPNAELMMQYMESLPEGDRPPRPDEKNQERKGEVPRDMQSENRSMAKEMPDDIKVVWVKEGNVIMPTQIKTGLSDGSNVEIISGLKKGDEVVTSMKLGEKLEENVEEVAKKSPFLQEGPGGGGKGHGPGGAGPH